MITLEMMDVKFLTVITDEFNNEDLTKYDIKVIPMITMVVTIITVVSVVIYTVTVDKRGPLVV
jgi:hypothetical protein